MQKELTIAENFVINNQYIIQKKLSSGSFGTIFLAIDKNTKEPIAMKLEEEPKDPGTISSVAREGEILMRLQDIQGIPKVFWTGTEKNHVCMAMALLEKDLAFFIKKHKTFSLKTILMLAEQLLLVLKEIHFRGIVHRDIKPENMMMGKGKNNKFIYLIDFGISKQFKDHSNRHIPLRKNKPFIGIFNKN